MYKALTALILSVSFPAFAETAISHIVVNQRWPWSEKVDVDFILSGETNDVEVTATWYAHPAPYRLGTLFSIAPGQRRLTWDPASSPFRGQVCIASRGKVEKLCMEVNAGTSADVSIRALRGSGGLKSP